MERDPQGSGKQGAVKYFPSTGKSYKEPKRIWNTALVTSGCRKGDRKKEDIL